jgi:hypothetical protein
MPGPLLFNSTDKELSFSVESDPRTVLHLSRVDGTISIDDRAGLGGSERIAGVLGIIKLRLAQYAVLATKAQIVGQLLGHDIYKVQKFELAALRKSRVKDDNETKYLALVEDHLKTAELFFSYTHDLTNSFQRQGSRKEGGEASLWSRADSRFFWNEHISEDLIQAATSVDSRVTDFILPVVYGVISLHETSIHGHPVTFGIISRRSKYRAGTRYFRRGIDSAGNVANFNETEQILVINDKVYSFVQTRGSVPAYWGEVNNLMYKPMLRIGGSAVDSARLHFDEQIKIYGPNFLVNLVNQKGYEKPVKDAYENVVRNLNDNRLSYVYFDFHHECSKMRWNRVDILINHLKELGFDEEGWFQGEIGSSGELKATKHQNGVVRSNCMDCLDRTNVVQSRIARYILQEQLNDTGLTESWEHDKDFVDVFRNSWGDNADGVSCSYSGTGALKTDFTRLGKRTPLGALQDLRNSIVRYVLNNFSDGPRQDAFDLFLGNHLAYETLNPPFADLRPLYIQAIPPMIFASILMIGAATFFPKEDNPWFINRVFILFWITLLLYSVRSLFKYGLQFVNWPKLCGLDFVTEEDKIKAGTRKGVVYVERPLGFYGVLEDKVK